MDNAPVWLQLLSLAVAASGSGLLIAVYNGWRADQKEQDKEESDGRKARNNLQNRNLRLQFDLERLNDYANRIETHAASLKQRWRDKKDLEATFDAIDAEIKSRPKIQLLALPGVETNTKDEAKGDEG